MRMRYSISSLLIAILCTWSPVPETEFALAGVTPAQAQHRRRADGSHRRAGEPRPLSLPAAAQPDPAAAVVARGPGRRSQETRHLSSWRGAAGVARRQGSGILPLGKHLVGVRPISAVQCPRWRPSIQRGCHEQCWIEWSCYRGDEPRRPGGRNAKPNASHPSDSGQHHAVCRPARSLCAAAARRHASPALNAGKSRHSVRLPIVARTPDVC